MPPKKSPSKKNTRQTTIKSPKRKASKTKASKTTKASPRKKTVPSILKFDTPPINSIRQIDETFYPKGYDYTPPLTNGNVPHFRLPYENVGKVYNTQPNVPVIIEERKDDDSFCQLL